MCICMSVLTVLTSRLHHLVELGLNVELWVVGLHTLQFDGHLHPRLDVGSCVCVCARVCSVYIHVCVIQCSCDIICVFMCVNHVK